jgi:hypothetical protein
MTRRLFFLLGLLVAAQAFGQELEPGAYSPAPVGMNIAVVALTYSTGELAFDPSGPISNASADIWVTALAYVRTLPVAGRSSSLSFALPYARGPLEGDYLGQHQNITRSGLADPRLRFAVNLLGAPALTPRAFATTTQEPTTLGASLVVSPPLGQYDSVRLINIGTNRWSFKPELGVRRTIRKWTLEAAAGVWLYTDNTNFYKGGHREQAPLGSLQWHVIYTFKPRCWLAVDANYYSGGRTTVNGKESQDLQHNSRVGVTFALPIDRQQSVKFTFNRGAITNIGANFNSFGLAWQYAWQ